MYHRDKRPLYVLRDWGQDTTADVVWAVVNHNSEFSVTATPAPEPASAAVLAGGSLLLACRRSRRR